MNATKLLAATAIALLIAAGIACIDLQREHRPPPPATGNTAVLHLATPRLSPALPPSGLPRSMPATANAAEKPAMSNPPETRLEPSPAPAIPSPLTASVSPVALSPSAAAATPPAQLDPQIPAAAAPVPQRAGPVAQARPIRRFPNDNAFALEIDPGVQVPAVILESETAFPPKLAEAKRAIARQFQREMVEVLAQPNVPAQAVEEAWSSARANADSQFRAIFGEEAANAWQMQAAREALHSKRR